MSTITKELAKLFRKITNSEIDAEGNAHVVLFPADSLLINNARIALASLEAEPAGCDACGGNGSVDIDHGEMGIEHIECPKCYTAPPAPVSVPAISDEEIYALAEKHDAVIACSGEGDYSGNSDSIVEFGRALLSRAAMLQGAEPVSNRDELPDGWVACSERMPNIGVPVSVPAITSCGDVVHCAVYVWDGKEWQDWYEEYDKLPFSTFTHWMALPAAPQLEVK